MELLCYYFIIRISSLVSDIIIRMKIKKKNAQFLVKLYGLCNPCFGVFCFHFLISSSINLCSLLPPFLDLYPRSYFSISLFFFFFSNRPPVSMFYGSYLHQKFYITRLCKLYFCEFSFVPVIEYFPLGRTVEARTTQGHFHPINTDLHTQICIHIVIHICVCECVCIYL